MVELKRMWDALELPWLLVGLYCTCILFFLLNRLFYIHGVLKNLAIDQHIIPLLLHFVLFSSVSLTNVCVSRNKCVMVLVTVTWYKFLTSHHLIFSTRRPDN